MPIRARLINIKYISDVFLKFRIFEAYESKIVNIPYSLCCPKIRQNSLFNIVSYKNKLILTKGKRICNHHMKLIKKRIFNYRLITDSPNFHIKEIKIEKTLKSFYKVLQKVLISESKNKDLNNQENLLENKTKILQEYDILFYIHGGGFLAQSTESVVGFLSE